MQETPPSPPARSLQARDAANEAHIQVKPRGGGLGRGAAGQHVRHVLQQLRFNSSAHTRSPPYQSKGGDAPSRMTKVHALGLPFLYGASLHTSKLL
jgi:hypothetical protein